MSSFAMVMRRMRCSVWVMALALLVAGGARVQAQDAARRIFDLTNQDRRAQGLQPLRWNGALAEAAQRHAELMAREGHISHQFPGEPEVMQRAAQAGAHFNAIAENVAMAPTAGDVETSWMHSAPHRANILDPRMDALGVGVAQRGNELFAVEDFAEAAQALSAQQVEQRVRALLRQDGIDASMSPQAAEEACAMSSGMPAGTNARLMVRMQTPDLQQVQSQVREHMRGGRYSRAAVGACRPIGQGAFTMYRVAVLLY
ncbi:MAG TPA: CAP domain-containing protein [Acidobacteriaceae bacterium]|nr:CAP domain-containing protein [Acidobacteriaceae bacterium]